MSSAGICLYSRCTTALALIKLIHSKGQYEIFGNFNSNFETNNEHTDFQMAQNSWREIVATTRKSHFCRKLWNKPRL